MTARWRRRRKRSDDSPDGAADAATGAAAPRGAPTITAVLEDGPLRGTRMEAEVIEGRPPKTLDVDGGSAGTCRYGLSNWVQHGPTAKYSFLYRV